MSEGELVLNRKSNMIQTSFQSGLRYQTQQAIPDILLFISVFRFLLGDPEGFPGQMRYIISPESPGSEPGSTPAVPTQLPKDSRLQEGSPDQMPSQQAATLLWALWTSEVLTPTPKPEPVTLRRELSLVASILSLVPAVTNQSSWLQVRVRPETGPSLNPTITFICCWSSTQYVYQRLLSLAKRVHVKGTVLASHGHSYTWKSACFSQMKLQ